MINVMIFNINNLELSLLELPKEDCTISRIVKSINEIVDDRKMKRLLAKDVNTFLKTLGVFDEEIINGIKVTIINETSEGYGIKGIDVIEENVSYKKILYNEKGKQFILKILSEITEESWYLEHYANRRKT